MQEEPAEKLLSPAFFAPFTEKVKGKVLYCSFSGGADSLALLLILSHWRNIVPFQLKAVHFEHGFRGMESLKDAEFCRKKCEEKNIPFQCVSLNVPANKLPGEGDEEAARRARLSAWKKIISQPEKEFIVTGHHGGDVMENMFLRLFRGGNTTGITSLRYFSNVENMVFFRPLLDQSKKDLEGFLPALNEKTWCVDSSNHENTYKRNFLRNRILPEIFRNFPFAEKGLLSAAKNLLCDASYIEENAEKFYRSFREKEYPLSDLESLHDAILIRVLRYFLSEKSSKDVIPDKRMLLRVREELSRYQKNRGEKNGEAIFIPVSSLENCFLVFSMDRLFFMEKKVKDGNEIVLLCTEEMLEIKKILTVKDENFSLQLEKISSGNFLKEENTFYFDMEKLAFPLYYSFWQGGEKMIPFGRRTPVLVKKLFSDAKIPAVKRFFFPLLSDSEGNILCAGKLRRSTLAQMDENTKNVLKITFL